MIEDGGGSRIVEVIVASSPSFLAGDRAKWHEAHAKYTVDDIRSADVSEFILLLWKNA